MIDSVYFCEPDEVRESWFFFTLQEKKQNDDISISGWNACYGNPNRVIRKLSEAKPDEKTTIISLCNELFYCRKKDIPIMTFERNIVPILRTRIAYLGIHDISFKKLHFIPLEVILQNYFYLSYKDSIPSLSMLVKQLKIETKNMSEPELLYKIYQKIGPLVPLGVIE